MGKGFNNYMTKKFFHPASKENIKRVWMAEQKTQFDKTKQEDLLAQYQKEQDMYRNRALLGDEKAKLGLSFMYDAPPGLKKKEQEEGEAEVKFDWQRKYNAPREQYAKNDEMIRDQPFGVEVRNVRCIKCRKWGHVNTDKICPLFGKDLTAEPEQPETSASSLLESMHEDGFTLKQSILGRMSDPRAANEQIVDSGDEDDPEVQFLKSLTPKQKKKLLKRLNKLQKKGKDRKSKKKNKHKKSSDSDDHQNRKMRKKSMQTDSSRSASSDDEPTRKQRSSQAGRVRPRQREDSSDDSPTRRGKQDNGRHRGQDDRHRLRAEGRKDRHRVPSTSEEEPSRGRKGRPGQSKNRRSRSLDDKQRVNQNERRRRRSSTSSEEERPHRKTELSGRRKRQDSRSAETVNERNFDKPTKSYNDGNSFRSHENERDKIVAFVRGDARGRKMSPRTHRSRSGERRRSRSHEMTSRSNERRQRSSDRGQHSRDGHRADNKNVRNRRRNSSDSD